MQSDPKPGDDFPMICETCLGNNPYMRMTKLPFGHKICKVSNLPYQPFRWKAGTHGRFKETIISYAVAKEKNICQACLNDMKYGLPVGVRDAMLRQQRETNTINELAPVHSVVGTQYHYQQLSKQQDADVDSGYGPSDLALTAAEYQFNAETQPQQQLLHDFSQRIHKQNTANRTTSATNSTTNAAQRAPEAIPFRNLAKLCTFWLSGSCRRVTNKSCPFRPCCGVYQFPELAGGDATMREANQTLIAQLQAEGPDKVQRTMDKNVRKILHDALKRRLANSSKGGNVDESIRARVHGSDALSQKYLHQMQGQIDKTQNQEEMKQSEISKGATDPAYAQVKSLWIGNLPPVKHEHPDLPVDTHTSRTVLQQTIWTALQRFGVIIVSVHIAQNLASAFIEYADHAQAMHALQIMLYDPPLVPSPVLLLTQATSAPSSSVSWQPMTLIRWATPPSLKRSRDDANGNPIEVMPAPPGMEQMHPSLYSLPNAPAPKIPLHDNTTVKPVPPPPTSEKLGDEETALKRRRTEKEENTTNSALGSLLSGYGSSDEEK